MALNQEYTNEIIAQIAIVTAEAVVQAILAERDGDECTMCRGDETGVRPKLAGPSPWYTFTDDVKSIYHTGKVDKAENIHAVKNMLDRQVLSQAEEEEDNEMDQFFQFCKLERHKSENV